MRIFLPLAVLLAGWSAAPLAAESFEASISGGQSLFRNGNLGSLSSSDLQNFIDAKDGFRLGARIAFNTHKFIGHEIFYGYSRTKLRDSTDNTEYGMPTHQFGYNFLLYALPDGFPVRPYAAGGGHFSTYYPPGSSAYYGNGYTKFGVNYGAGVKVKINPLFHIRVDVRDYINTKPLDLINKSGVLHMIEASAGFGIQF